MIENEQMSLDISEAVETLMDERQVLREDVQETIRHAETTGEKFVDPSSGRSLAFYRPGRVTFWVEYSRAGEVFQIYRVYSHRMEMKRKGTP